MYAHLYRVVFCRKTERIPAHGMDHIMTLHKFVTAPGIRDNISSPVTYMKSVSRRIREHIKTIIFRLFAVVYIYRILKPVFTPFFLYGLVMKGHRHFSTSKNHDQQLLFHIHSLFSMENQIDSKRLSKHKINIKMIQRFSLITKVLSIIIISK